ncbi:cupin domain-containing protein [Chloroflexota bacterium]
MKIIKMADVKQEEIAGDLFEGKVSRQVLIDSDVSKEFMANLINFSPGARNIFHKHTNEQILYVTVGKGIVATEQEEHVVTPGTIILIPAGENHWHGAVPESAFSHIAITVPGQKTSFQGRT